MEREEVNLSNCPACEVQLTRMIERLDSNIKAIDLIKFVE
jgi:hypothetical protein